MNIRKPWKQTPSYKGEEKAESYNFFDISSFFRFDTHRNALGVLSDQTCSDLGFENLFMFSDRTASRIGQQYLYNLMRIIPDKAGEIERHEALINELSSHPDLQEELVKDLQILNTHEAYSIASLMGIGFPAVPVWRKILFRICGFLPALFLLLLYFYQAGAWLLLLIAAILVNGVIHYGNKPNNLNFLISIPQLIRLLNISGKLSKNPLFTELGKEVPEALSSLETLRKASGHLRMESKMDSDLAVILWAIMECVKIFFLAEPIAYHKVITLLKDKNRQIETVFRFGRQSVVGRFSAEEPALLLSAGKAGRRGADGDGGDVSSPAQELCCQYDPDRRPLHPVYRFEYVGKDYFHPYPGRQYASGTDASYSFCPADADENACHDPCRPDAFRQPFRRQKFLSERSGVDPRYAIMQP